VYSESLMHTMGLGGLIHIWGEAGAGKTLLAAALASSVSKRSKVEWINGDAKTSFVTHLKKNVELSGGHMNNITVNIAENRAELNSVIRSLPETSSTASLIVIDPITRVLDMTHEDPVLWGQELIEVVLPTLAGTVNRNDVDIVIISENRMLSFSQNQAVHYQSITKWIDHDLHIIRDFGMKQSQILRNSKNGMKELGTMKIDERGAIEVISQIAVPNTSRGDSRSVW
jgi:archaellum biogenesis ATPase FlaH